MKQASNYFHARRNFVIVALASTLSMFASQALAQKLTWIGSPPGFTGSRPAALSQTGAVIVGDGYGTKTHAFRWQGGVFTDLGTLADDRTSSAKGTSADGSVVVGSATDENGYPHAFRWQNSVMTDLGTLGGLRSFAVAVSADGNTVLGYGPAIDGVSHILSWSGDLLSDLGPGQAKAASGDGSVVVGMNSNTGYLWQGSVATDLGALDEWSSAPNAVSADGSVVVGNSAASDGWSHAFRWHGNLMTDLGTLGGSSSDATSVSSDGSVVVGNSDTMFGPTVFVWTAADGMQDLNVLVGSQLQDESYLNYAVAVSANGKVIVGYGFNGSTGRIETWRVDLASENAPPTVSVSEDKTLEATGPETTVTMSGSATDLDEDDQDSLTYTWAEGGAELGTGTELSVSLPLGTHEITFTATDPQGAQGSATIHVEIVDTTSPSITNIPADQTVEASGAGGTAVSFVSTAKATDLVDGELPMVYSRLSGSVFPLGTSVVAISAEDLSKNAAVATFKVWVRYSWSGLLAPIYAAGTRTSFKLGSTVPIKFRLTGASSSVSNAVATFNYRKVDDTAEPVTESECSEAPMVGILFRYDAVGGQYIFKWGTKGLTSGTYEISVDLGDGVTRTAMIDLS